jgi:hypothetical protein
MIIVDKSNNGKNYLIFENETEVFRRTAVVANAKTELAEKL